jgi:glc operon protein GlcG
VRHHKLLAVVAVIAVLASTTARTGAQGQAPYGAPIGADAAKKAAAAALAEARRNNWTVAAAIVDPAGELVYFEKVDSTQMGSTEIAIEKARTAARFKRPSKEFEDVISAGGSGLRMLGVPFVLPVAGGVPLVVDGKIVGAIGVSGGTNVQDAQCATLGAAALK